VYDGYWMWGRPSLADLWADLRDAGAALRRTGRRRMADLAWLALLDTAGPTVAVTDPRDGTAAGHLLVTVGRAKPHRTAVRVEPSLVGDGPALAVSLVLPPRGVRPLFDDPAVVGAMRAVLRDPGRTTLFSTLVDGPTQWAGSISGADPRRVADRPAWWAEDPFARLGLQHRLLVPAGVLCPRPLPAGPGHQRHAGAPWPWGAFEQHESLTAVHHTPAAAR
jgi:hypothetical protein